MRKIILVISLVAISMFSYAQFSMTIDWVYTNTTFSNISSGAYNFVTDHFYALDYDDAAQPVAILNSDGTESGSGLDTSGLTLGTLNVFAICVDAEGVIYGGTNTEPDCSLIRWANESATPTEQTITGFLFPRTMDVKGTGTDTIIAVTGSDDNGPVQILTTTDGVNFTISDTTPGLTGVKHGIAISADGQTIFGSQGYLGNLPVRHDNVEGVWTQSTLFSPPSDALNTPCPLGYWDERNVLFCLDTRATDDQLSALDGTTGALLGQLPTGVDIATYGYGVIDLKPGAEDGEGRWIARISGGYTCGKFTFSYPKPLAASNWALYD